MFVYKKVLLCGFLTSLSSLSLSSILTQRIKTLRDNLEIIVGALNPEKKTTYAMNNSYFTQHYAKSTSSEKDDKASVDKRAGTPLEQSIKNAVESWAKNRHNISSDPQPMADDMNKLYNAVDEIIYKYQEKENTKSSGQKPIEFPEFNYESFMQSNFPESYSIVNKNQVRYTKKIDTKDINDLCAAIYKDIQHYSDEHRAASVNLSTTNSHLRLNNITQHNDLYNVVCRVVKDWSKKSAPRSKFALQDSINHEVKKITTTSQQKSYYLVIPQESGKTLYDLYISAYDKQLVSEKLIATITQTIVRDLENSVSTTMQVTDLKSAITKAVTSWSALDIDASKNNMQAKRDESALNIRVNNALRELEDNNPVLKYPSFNVAFTGMDEFKKSNDMFHRIYKNERITPKELSEFIDTIVTNLQVNKQNEVPRGYTAKQ